MDFFWDDSTDNVASLRFFRSKELSRSGQDWSRVVKLVQPDARFVATDSTRLLKEYIAETAQLAAGAKVVVGSTSFTPVFISANRQQGRFVALSAQRIASISKTVLADVGIDERQHSIRGVSSSHEYRVTGDIAAVVRRGRWSSADTFHIYYEMEFEGGPYHFPSLAGASWQHSQYAPVHHVLWTCG